jgi:tRNA U38,U39,U40 pseudouridine synthase TruA
VWLRARGRLILVDIEADRFLRRMARAIVGLLIEVGSGARPIAPLAAWHAGAALATRPRVAPARGLYLQRVRYAAGLFEAGAAAGGATTPAISMRPQATVSTLSAIWA